ncbi:uncharacterized protein LOC142241234 [Haematobia irritans]|uniref:uncharacterized protein LOC142241234 n=1 Tax=Haematobia irritans TaxID=7368 RepID=UPI003F501C83
MKCIIALWSLVVMVTILELPLALADVPLAHLDQKTIDACIAESGVNAEETEILLKDDLEHLDESKFSHSMKCFHFCFYSKLGFFDENGNPIASKFITFMSGRYPDKKDKVEAAITKCKALTDPNPCEYAFNFEICMAHTLELGKW